MMLSMVRWCLGSPAFLGVLLGAIVTSTYPRVTWGGSAPARPTPPACQQSWPVEIEAFVRTQCDIHAAIFGTDEEPGAAFAFDKNITRTGIHEGTTWFGETVVLEVVSATLLMVDRAQSPQIPEGFTATVVVGRMSGPAGRVGVLGIHMKTAGLTEDPDYVFVATSVISESDIELHARFERLAAGARVVNRLTGQSTPLALVSNGTYASLSTSESDMSTMYGDPPAAPGDPAIGVDCVRDAMKAAQIDRSAAEDQMKYCVLEGVAAFAACMGRCAHISMPAMTTGPIGWWLLGGCAVFCLLAMVAYAAWCQVGYNRELERIEAQLRRVLLSQCGVYFFQV